MLDVGETFAKLRVATKSRVRRDEKQEVASATQERVAFVARGGERSKNGKDGVRSWLARIVE